MSRANYFCKMIDKVQYLDPPIPEQFMINKIMRHFEQRAQFASIGRTISESLENVIEFLRTFESMEDQHRENREERKNYQGNLDRRQAGAMDYSNPPRNSYPRSYGDKPKQHPNLNNSQSGP